MLGMDFEDLSTIYTIDIFSSYNSLFLIQYFILVIDHKDVVYLFITNFKNKIKLERLN